MHVLYVIDSLVPAGAERSLAELAPRYSERGVTLDVAFLREAAGLQDELLRAGARLYEISDRRVGGIRKLHSLIRERRPDLVHTTLFEADISGRLAARISRVPVVSTLANDKYGADHLANPYLRPWKVRATQVLDLATVRAVARLHAVSSFVANVMARRLHFPRNRIDVIHRGRDPQMLGRRNPRRRARARAELGIASDTPVLLAVARQDQHKGLDGLLQALPLVGSEADNLRLLVAGRDGSQTSALNQLVRRLGLEEAVTFLGVRSDVPELLSAADVFVLPSHREGFPGSVLEAMALELPIVVSDLPQVREVVDESCALLVPPGSPAALAAAVKAISSDPGAAAARAGRARARFEQHFTVDHVADEMLSFYERALSSSGRPRRAMSRAGR
ncbi:MAG: glycosyltransferase [Acidimicrobiia bacterium]